MPKIIKHKTIVRAKHVPHKTNILCQQAKNSIKSLTSNNILSSYTKYLSLIINKFITNPIHKHTLERIFAIKHKIKTKVQNITENNTAISSASSSSSALVSSSLIGQINNPNVFIQHYKHIEARYQIPKFIELFKYLFTKPNFIKHFTTDELSSINNILTNTHYTHDKHQKHQIYEYLDNNSIGEKISNTYYKEFHSFTNDIEQHFPSIKFHQLLINSFTSYTILENIEHNMTTLTIGSLEYTNTSTSTLINIKHDSFLYIYNNGIGNSIGNSIGNGNGNGMANLKILTHNIIDRILFFNEFLETDKLPNKFIIFLTNQKKEIDNALEHKAHFRTLNVNSAVTNGQDIIIYRKQELLKSIFHELIHFHTMDFRSMPPNSEVIIIKYLKTTHNIADSNKYLLYECITESLANILNNIYSRETHNIKDFKKHFINELIFSTLQVAKILQICKYTSWEEFTLTPIHTSTGTHHNTHNHAKQFKQDSCVFSYYILKLYILLNIDEYWAILDKQLKFISNENNFTKLMAIFEKGRKDTYLSSIINAILDSNIKLNIHKNIKNTNRQRRAKIYKTLRMTCIHD